MRKKAAIRLTVVALCLASASCGAATSVYDTAARALQAVGRTATGGG